MSSVEFAPIDIGLAEANFRRDRRRVAAMDEDAGVDDDEREEREWPRLGCWRRRRFGGERSGLETRFSRSARSISVQRAE